MVESKFEERHFERYLRLLDISKQKPSFIYLKKIIETQLSRIPFENISKLFLKKRYDLKQLIDFESYLDGIEKYGFGGTCYSINFYLNQLLNWLGFDIKLCGADMKNPDVHLVSIISIQNREFLIDAGYAAPFSEPLPLDLQKDYLIEIGPDQYILKPQTKNSYSTIELYRNGELKHGYRINPKARNIDEFRPVIEASFEENATFMNALLLTRFYNNHYIMIHNMTFIESSNGNILKKNSIETFEQLTSIIHDCFSIPKPIIIESLGGLQMQKNVWS